LNLTRKEIGRLVGLSATAVKRNEKRLGIAPVRINSRTIRYPERKTVSALRRLGLEV